MVAPQLPPLVRFGPFELNTTIGELTKSGVRIRLAGQPLDLLLLLLERPGEVASSAELRKKLWSDGTFVDFEHGLHAVVNKLRRTLGDTAENARYIETVPGFGYRFIGSISEILAAGLPGSIALAPENPKRTHVIRWWWFAAAACLTLPLFLLQIHRLSAPSESWQLSKQTSDPGLSCTPAISRDGTLVAYSSDRGSPGQLDLYVKQVSGNTPLRLTFDGLGNTTPEFSPDGSKIVFHSSRDGGGIYAIPTFGGQPRLLAKEGQNPKFSPDGSKVAYWIGGENVASAVPGSGTVWIVPIEGGQAWQMATSLTGARYPVWSPDGQGLLIVGYASSRAYENNLLDWWFVSLNGKRLVKTGIEIPLTRAGLQDRDALGAHRGGAIPNPSCWSATGAVTFSAQSGSARNLWQTFVSPDTGKAKGELKRLTVGAANEWEPACGQEDRIVFTSLQVKRNVWSVPFNLNAGKSKGRLEQVTDGLEREEHAALSRNARYVAFASPQAGIENIWLREIATGKELRLAESPNLQQRFPVISPSGGKVAFSVYWPDGSRSVNIAGLGGPEEEACKGECLRATDWSSDEKSLLIFGGNPYHVSALDIGSRTQTVLFKHDRSNLLYARYSPDNRWVSFTSRFQSNHSTIMIAPTSGERPIPESQWIKIADAGPEDWANWSPDGQILYFTSARDGHSCLWGRRLDPASCQPVGDAFAAFHLHGSATYQQGGWSAAGDRIAMVLTTDSGNVWLLSRSRSR